MLLLLDLGFTVEGIGPLSNRNSRKTLSKTATCLSKKRGTMPNTLIAYFSRAGQNYVSGNIVDLPKGNTAIAAEIVANQTGGDLFEIATKKPYAADYHDCVEESRSELAAHARPELRELPANINKYGTIVLGYPNWCGDMPMAVYTFLDAFDFSGKKILPFCTNEGSGASGTDKKIAATCPGATVAPALSITGHKAAESASAIEEWLKANL